jgi:HSP20 family protein
VSRARGRDPTGPSAGELMRAPDTDVIETENEIRVVAEMPGLRREDIELQLEQNVLTVSGEKREQREQEGEGTYHLSERRYGRLRAGLPGTPPPRRAARLDPERDM